MSVTTSDSNTNGNQQMMPELKYLIRVKTEIPVVKLGYEFITRFITGFKDSSIIVEWSLNKASNTVDQVVKYPMPYIKNQLLAIDHLLCRSLDLTELNLPVLTKTPQEVYGESAEYVKGMISPITDWVDVELLPPMEYYIDRYLPELDPNHHPSKDSINDGKGSKTGKLSVKLIRRVKQHAYAEPKYFGNLIYRVSRESILLMKTIIFNPRSMSKTFHKVWKKLGDGVTPDEAAKSLLLVEMGCIKLRQGISSLVIMVEITAEMAKCYIEMFIKYVNEKKNFVAYHLLPRIVNPTLKLQMQTPANTQKKPSYEKTTTQNVLKLEDELSHEKTEIQNIIKSEEELSDKETEIQTAIEREKSLLSPKSFNDTTTKGYDEF